MARCKGCIHENVCNREVGYGYSVCPHCINSADVVPKSEVDILKSLITHKEDEAYERGYAEGKSDAAKEIFEEIEKTVFADMDFFKELKKKYTEGEDNGTIHK